MMNRTTGRTIGDADHLRQSVADILTTPIGSRILDHWDMWSSRNQRQCQR